MVIKGGEFGKEPYQRTHQDGKVEGLWNRDI